MKKVGVIRCQKVETSCTGKMDIEIAQKGVMGFKDLGPSTIIGLESCGGSPGDGVINSADHLIESGAEVIAFATCLSEGNPDGSVCPYAKDMISLVKDHISGRADILINTH